MKTFLLLALLFFTAMPIQTYSQSKAAAASAERMTNKSVLALHSAGLKSDVIIAKIEETACTFNLSTENLISLKKAGMPDVIIQAMMDKSNRENAVGKNAIKKAPGDMPAAEMVNHPYYFNQKVNSLKPLEKSVAGINTKYVALGYGGVKFQYQIQGAKSGLRLSQADSLAFLINTAGATMPDMILYKLKSEEGGRNAVSLQTKAMGAGVKSADNVITFNVIDAKNGLFKIVPVRKLEPGEYFFAGKPVAGASTLDVFAFGID